ncbi:MAG TPA: hypothetical protein VJ045_11075 [Hyphomicrobiaceae bacterium]|nr:hypothetical protein [Hyphomicrobiaceae bacterium]HLB07688.1 hypothetical protein [Alphaproteobacteria bacterium]
MEDSVITDIRIPFWRLVVIFVKWAIAAIPATIIVILIYMAVFGLIAGLLGGLPQIPSKV